MMAYREVKVHSFLTLTTEGHVVSFTPLKGIPILTEQYTQWALEPVWAFFKEQINT